MMKILRNFRALICLLILLSALFIFIVSYKKPAITSSTSDDTLSASSGGDDQLNSLERIKAENAKIKKEFDLLLKSKIKIAMSEATPPPPLVVPAVGGQAPVVVVATTPAAEPKYNYLKKYPFFLECNHNYADWQKQAAPVPDMHDYSQRANNETHEIRIVRAVVVYFPVERGDEYTLEFKWLYRSWIEMQRYEPAKWRTDLVVFLDDVVAIKWMDELNCTTRNRRTSANDKPMCTLITYKPIRGRKLPPLAANYTSLSNADKFAFLLNNVDIFTRDETALAPFYSMLKDALPNYGYADSILMGFDGYDYFAKAGFDFLIRSDMDVFLTPLFSLWLPRYCNDFYVGRGAYSTTFNVKRLKRIAENLGLEHAGIQNLGSTWYSTPHQFRIVSYLTLFGMAYLGIEEFSQVEREHKLGTMLWPDWHYGVLLLYGQNLALNHLIGLKQFNVIKLENYLDYPSGNIESIFSKLHIHVFHGDDMFSKFMFKAGRYDNMTTSAENETQVKYYALKMALDAKRISSSNLTKLFSIESEKKI